MSNTIQDLDDPYPTHGRNGKTGWNKDNPQETTNSVRPTGNYVRVVYNNQFLLQKQYSGYTEKYNETRNIRSAYIRFGEIPFGERLYNYSDEQYEYGVSVYNGYVTDDNYAIPQVDFDPSHTVWPGAVYRNEPVYEVTGEVIGFGSDHEPLLKNVKITQQLQYEVVAK